MRDDSDTMANQGHDNAIIGTYFRDQIPSRRTPMYRFTCTRPWMRRSISNDGFPVDHDPSIIRSSRASDFASSFFRRDSTGVI
jgi:hypothetical protein